MAASTPPSLPKGKGIGIEPFPPPRTPNLTVNTRAGKNNNNNLAPNQGATASYVREVNLKVDFEDSEVDTDTNTARDPADLDPDAEGEADGDEDDMPKPRPQPIKREADISLILTLPQRHDLTKLSDDIQDRVFEQISKATRFLEHPRAQAGRIQIWNYAPAVKAAIAAQETNKEDIYSAFPKPGQEQGEAQQDMPKIRTKIDVDGVKPTPSSMSVLRDEVNAYFAKWKLTFTKRFIDLIVTNQPNFGAGPPRQGQGAPRGGAMAGGRPQQQVNMGNAYQADLNLIRRFPPIETPLCKLPVDKRRLLVHAMILMMLSTEHYISFNRIYLLYLASSLHLPQSVLIEEENRIARGLGKIYKTLCEEAEVRELENKKLVEKPTTQLDEGFETHELPNKLADGQEFEVAYLLDKTRNVQSDAAMETHKAQGAQHAQQAQQAQQAQETKIREPKRKWRPNPNPIQVGNSLLDVGIGLIEAHQGLPSLSLAPVTVAHLIGPLGDCEVACGVYFGVNFTRPAFRSLEAQMLGIEDGAIIALHCSDGALKEIRDPKEVTAEDRRMRLVLCINGLLTSEDDIFKPWTCLGHHNEIMSVRWETEALEKVGNALKILVRSKAWPETKQQLRGKLINTIMDLNQWPESLMRVSKIVDNPYFMAYQKSTKVGESLANCIVSHVLGERGMTLIAHGLGARIIYLCLLTLAERKMYGVVDTVVVMGAPIVADAATWSVMKSVVSGRLVNVFSATDYMLAFASRTVIWGTGIAGCQQIEGVGGVENHDVSDILDAHVDYPALVPTILRRIGWEDLKPELKPPPMQPKALAGGAQKTLAAAGKPRPGQVPTQVQGKSVAIENKENTFTQRGGRNSRAGGRGGTFGGRGGAINNNAGKRLADEMGKMNL